jgi:hypothetical protein
LDKGKIDRVNRMDRIREEALRHADLLSLLNLDNPVNPLHFFSVPILLGCDLMKGRSGNDYED